MLSRSDIKRLITDLFRGEMGTQPSAAQVVFDRPAENLWSQVPAEVLRGAVLKAGVMFGYQPLAFSSLELMTDYAYASYLHTRQITLFSSHSPADADTPCRHTTEMIWEETRGVAPLFSGIKRIVSLVPSIHGYGFTFTVCLPHVLQVPVVTLPTEPAQAWEQLLLPGDLVVAVPSFWDHWLRCNERFPQQVSVLSSTAPCKNETITALKQAGAAHFVEIYGASHTGAVGWRTREHASFEILPFWDVSFMNNTPYIKRKSQTRWLPLPGPVLLEEERFFVPRTTQEVPASAV